MRKVLIGCGAVLVVLMLIFAGLGWWAASKFKDTYAKIGAPIFAYVSLNLLAAHQPRPAKMSIRTTSTAPQPIRTFLMVWPFYARKRFLKPACYISPLRKASAMFSSIFSSVALTFVLEASMPKTSIGIY